MHSQCSVILSLIGLLSTSSIVCGQERFERWEDAIKAFEASDAAQMPPEGACLFVGSSSIRLWDLEASFPQFETINRGFGGSQTEDVNHFFDRIVAPYAPKVIVIYEGDNDIASGKTVEEVVTEQARFFHHASETFPDAHVLYLPIKPSIARAELWPRMHEANLAVRRMINTHSQWHYVDTAMPMLDADGQPFEDLFVDDGLHLNEKGYALWTEITAREIQHAIQTMERSPASGVVYHDRNHNQRFDQGDATLDGVYVSNGRDIVATDENGQYTLPIDEDDILFVIKPRGWRTPITRDQLPHFYYIHKPNGSPHSRFPGVEPTGDLPDSIDFPLYPQVEPEEFQAIFFGDPQPRNQTEVDYVTRDVVESLIGTNASFGVTLGDITFDNLDLFEKQNGAIALIGIPWYNVIGNHDVNREARIDTLSDESFERVYGPSYYSFDYGPAHFVVLDNIEWYFDARNNRSAYRAGFGDDQLRFVREDLSRVPEDKLVVLMMHIPIVGAHDREELYRIIERREFCMSISGHTHHHEHRFIQREDGWRGIEPHHHVINVTVSGSWWGGVRDERGIPHATMADGAPNGYSIIGFDGNQYTLDFRAAGRPDDYQMRINLPIELSVGETEQQSVFVNVFNGSERSKVEMKIDGVTTWKELEYSVENDPYFAELSTTENSVENRDWVNLPNPKASPHLWKTELGQPLSAGFYLMQIRTTDMHGRVYEAARAFRVTESTD